MGSLNPFKKPKMPVIPAPVELPAYVPPPEPEPVVAAPSVDDEAIRRKKLKARQEQSQKSGRASTFLSDEEDFG